VTKKTLAKKCLAQAYESFIFIYMNFMQITSVAAAVRLVGRSSTFLYARF
jgi:hypothetical protein